MILLTSEPRKKTEPPDDKLPAKLPALHELHGDKLVVTYDPDEGSALVLETGYALARARVLMARGAADGIDTAAIEEAAARALELLGQVRTIKQSLTAAKTSIDRGAGTVEEMARAVREQLDEITALAAAADDGEPPTA